MRSPWRQIASLGKRVRRQYRLRSVAVQANAVEVVCERRQCEQTARAERDGHRLLEELRGLRLGQSGAFDEGPFAHDAGDARARHLIRLAVDLTRLQRVKVPERAEAQGH